MMKSLLFIIAGLIVSWHFTELEADNPVTGLLAPIGVLVFLVALALWLLIKVGFGSQTSPGDIGGFDDIDAGGGD